MIRLTENYGNIGNELVDTFKETNSDLQVEKVVSCSYKILGAFLMVRGGMRSYGALNKMFMREKGAGSLLGGVFRGALGWDLGEIGHTRRERIENNKELTMGDFSILVNNMYYRGLNPIRGSEYTDFLYKNNLQKTVFLSRIFRLPFYFE